MDRSLRPTGRKACVQTPTPLSKTRAPSPIFTDGGRGGGLYTGYGTHFITILCL